MHLRTNLSREVRRGNVAVLAAVSFIGILFLSALAIDSGMMLAARRQAQNCADAGALAGCIQLASIQAQGNTPTQQQIATAVNLSLGHNNFTDGTNCTVVVNSPPSSGNFQDNSSVEVLLTFTYNNMVVTGGNSITVRSVASCTTSGSPSLPMVVLDPTGAKSFWVHSGSFTESSANIQVNSNDDSAAVVDGKAGSAANAAVQAVGGSTGSFTPAVKGGQAPVNNPYALLPIPSNTGMTTYTQSSYVPDGNGKITLNPGYYPNGLYCINGGNVTLNPGLYYVEHGNFWVNTTGTVTGDGVTIYHNGSDNTALLAKDFGLNVGICLCLTDSNYTLNPPTTGPYAGISLFHSPDYTGQAFYDFWGSASLNVGIQYFPASTLRCWSATHGGTINCNELVANHFKLTGPHDIYGEIFNHGFSKLTWNASRAANRPPTNVFLAE
jgi:Flp pilus assembly protein TadG